jgi:hypothetical protein
LPVPLLAKQDKTWQPQSRRCHLPNNQIVKDQSATGPASGERKPTEARRSQPAEQEARTKLPHGKTTVQRRQLTESRSCFAPSRRLSRPLNPAAAWLSRLIQRQAAEYRARSAGRQLGAKILESVRKTRQKPSFYPSPSIFLFKQFLLRIVRLTFFGNQLYES